MRIFQSWICCVANMFCFLLMLLWVSYGGCRASNTLVQIEARPHVSELSNSASSEPVDETEISQERVGFKRLVLNPLTDFYHMPTIAYRAKTRNDERRRIREPSEEDETPNLSWVRDHQHYREKTRRHQDLWLSNSLIPIYGRSDSAEDFPYRAGDEIVSKLSLRAAQAEATLLLNCAGAISEAEYQALQDLYLATGGANWTWHNISSSSGESQWVFPSNLTAPCSDGWEGVRCAPFKDPVGHNFYCAVIGLELPFTGLRGQLTASIASLRHVEKLNLADNHLEGSIPSSLGDLSTLTLLSLSTNSLICPIPSSLGNMPVLMTLYLHHNSLTGPIPTSLGGSSSLEILYLYENSLAGPIPSSLGDLATTLTQLVLYENSLTGPLPSSLGDLAVLTSLDLSQNFMTGPIPSSMSSLAALTGLYLYDNSLTGPIPTSLGDLTALTQLALNENLLTGSIPSALGNLGSTLTLLYLNQNLMTGIIPSSLADLTALTLLYLSENFLMGPIQFNVGNLAALTGLYLETNSLTGQIPSSLSHLTVLTKIILNDNSLTGPIPSSLGDLTALTGLYLNANSLTGPIPSSLGDLEKVTGLYLNDNLLSGPIPSSLGNLPVLTILYLNENSLTGPIPSSLGQLKALTQFSVSSNSVIGTIPTSLGLLGKCFYVNMSSNSLAGTIPIELGNIGSNLTISDQLVKAGVALDFSQNALTGTLPPLLFSKQMQTLLLYSNCMRGSLPSEICSSSNLQTLVLDKLTSGSSCQSKVLGFHGTFAATTLQDSIPECVWTMPQLQTLHLSGNGLHGTLGDIGSISSLVTVDVSNNFLTGALPTSLQTQQSLQQLDLANNKLSGTLSPSFVMGNLTLLILSVNRLSGDIPDSFANTPNVRNFSVLTGNLFGCESALPGADPASSSYICGSETFDIGLSICGCALLVLIFLTLSAFLYLRGYSGFGCVFIGKLLDEGINALKQQSKLVLTSANLRHSIDVVEALKVWLCALGFCYLVISLPAYAISKRFASAAVLTEQYTWVTTSAFLHGYAAMALVVLFVLFSGLFLVSIVQRLDSLLKRAVNKSSSAQLLQLKTSSQHLQLRNVLQRVLMQTGSLAVVLVVNVLYVYGVVFGNLSLSEEVLTQIALGLFKVLWQQLVVTYAISWIAENHADISVGGLIFYQVVLNVASFIVAPCFATLGTDSNCLYYALVGLQPISSSFTIALFRDGCTSIASHNGGSRTFCIERPYLQPTTISIAPPWFYSYQCTSALLTNYTPALLIIFVTNAVALPLLQLILITLPQELETRSAFLKYLRKQSPPSCRKPVADVLLDLLVLMTFGLASPLLGVMIVVKQITTALLSRILISHYLQQAEDPTAALTALEDAAQQFRGGDTRALLGFLLSVVGLFWGAMIFDMVADLYGNTAGGIAWAVAFAVWATVAALAYAFAEGSKKRFYSKQGIFSSQKNETHESRDLFVLLAANAFMFDSSNERGDEGAGGDGDDDRDDIHGHNSAFVEGRNSELELI